MTWLDAALAAVVRRSAERRRSIFVVWGALACLAIAGVAQVEIRTTTDSVLVTNDEAWDFYQRSKALFEGDDLLVVALHYVKPVTPAVLKRVECLSRDLEEIHGIRRVDSLATVAFIKGGSSGALDLAPTVAPDVHPALIKRLEANLREDRIAPGSLVSKDARTVAIDLYLDEDDRRHAWIIDQVRERVTRDSPGTFWLSGVPVFRVEATERTRGELEAMVPITIVLMVVVMGLLFRNVLATIFSLVVSGLGVLMMLAGMGFSGSPITLITAILPPVLLAIGTAYAIHFVRALQNCLGEELRGAAIEAVTTPICVSGLTTAVGFAAMGQVNIDTISELGLFGAAGVLATLAATLTLGPALAPWIRPKRDAFNRSRVSLDGFAQMAARNVTGRRGSHVIVMWLVIGLVMVVGLRELHVETDVSRWFSVQDPTRVAYDSIARELSGISPVNVVVEAIGERLVTDPGALARIDGLGRFIAEAAIVGKVVSFADPIRQLNGGFLDDEAEPLPTSRSATEQLLLMLESVDQISDLVTDDRRAANIMVRLEDSSSSEILRVARASKAWWEQNGDPNFTVQMTGIMHEFARSEDEIAWGQIRGLTLAFAAILVMFFAIFRSLRLSIVAILPNATPILMLFGAMGLAGIPLDAGTVLVGCVALGIAVDDTVHIVHAYSKCIHEGRDPSTAAAESVQQVGPSLVVTTITIGLGFLALALSDFLFTRNLGILISASMIVCLIADVTLLPALLARWGALK